MSALAHDELPDPLSTAPRPLIDASVTDLYPVAGTAALATPDHRPDPRSLDPVRETELRLVESGLRTAKRGPFVALIIAMVVVGLGAAFGLNTMVAQMSGRATEVNTQLTNLDAEILSLQQKIAEDQSPITLAAKAIQLGMVQGKVLGPTSDGTGIRLAPQGQTK